MVFGKIVYDYSAKNLLVISRGLPVILLLGTNEMGIDLLTRQIYTPVEYERRKENIMTNKHVFISYSHENADIAKALIRDLAQVNIEVWIDKNNLQPGSSNWRTAIEQAIASAQAVIFIASPAAKNSQIVNDELGRAMDNTLPVIPFWVDGVAWFDTAPLGFGQMQYIDARNDGYRLAFTQLVVQLKAQETRPNQQVAISKNSTNELGTRYEIATKIRVNPLTVVLKILIFSFSGFLIGILLRNYIISTVVPGITSWGTIISYVKNTFGGLFGNDTATIQNTVTVTFLTIIGFIVGSYVGVTGENQRVDELKKELKGKSSSKTTVPNTTLEDYYKLYMNFLVASQNNDRERMRELLSNAPDGVKWLFRLNGIDPDNFR